MRKAMLICAGVLLGASISLSAAAQTKAPPNSSANSAAKPTAAAKPKAAAQGKVPDFSGDWGATLESGGGNSFDPSDPEYKKTGTPQDTTPYQPWALAKLNSEIPEQGPRASFANTTDPRIKYCDPVGVPRIYLVPTQFRFVQTPGIVYILYQYGPTWRPIRMNRAHSEDPDPTWWGESVGKYEGDTLVIDTVGFNDKTWLDHSGRPHSDQLHLVERFRRMDHDTLQLDLLFDDPKAYTKPWTGKKIFKLQHAGFDEAYACSVSEYQHFEQSVVDPVIAPKK